MGGIKTLPLTTSGAKLLYLFHTPLIPVSSFTKQISPKSYNVFCLEQRGLGVPNLVKYYQAAQITLLVVFICGLWCPLTWNWKQLNITPINRKPLPWIPPDSCLLYFSSPLKHTVNIWNSTKFSSKMLLPQLPLLPITGNPPPFFYWDSNPQLPFLSGLHIHLPWCALLMEKGFVLCWVTLQSRFKALPTWVLDYIIPPKQRSPNYTDRFWTYLVLHPLAPKQILLIYSQLNRLPFLPTHTYVTRPGKRTWGPKNLKKTDKIRVLLLQLVMLQLLNQPIRYIPGTF